MKTTKKTPPKNKAETCAADRLFLTDDALRGVLRRTGMPVMLYDEKGLREIAKSLSHVSVFSAPDISVSDCPFPEILRVLCEEGLHVVCRSPKELRIALDCGFPGDRIRYAGVCVLPELGSILRGLGAELWIGSPIAIPERLPERVALLCALPPRASFQLQAASHRHRAGLTAEEATVIASMAKRRGVRELVLAACPDGNRTSAGTLAFKASQLIALAEKIRQESGAELGGIHLGSGLGLEYNRFKEPVDEAAELEALQKALAAAPRAYRVSCSVSRRLLEPHAVFVAACLGAYERERATLVIDASFRQLAIPQLDRYRHISVLGRSGVSGRRATDVVGTDLLAKDWFAEARLLPPAEEGDALILHDVGCCASGMTECCLCCADGTLLRLSRDPDCSGAFPGAPSDPFPSSNASG